MLRLPNDGQSLSLIALLSFCLQLRPEFALKTRFSGLLFAGLIALPPLDVFCAYALKSNQVGLD